DHRLSDQQCQRTGELPLVPAASLPESSSADPNAFPAPLTRASSRRAPAGPGPRSQAVLSARVSTATPWGLIASIRPSCTSNDRPLGDSHSNETLGPTAGIRSGQADAPGELDGGVGDVGPEGDTDVGPAGTVGDTRDSACPRVQPPRIFSARP